VAGIGRVLRSVLSERARLLIESATIIFARGETPFDAHEVFL
jgi:hypothetical protein